ncbi:MAG: YARHG domain-containing protein [Niabella sp.]
MKHSLSLLTIIILISACGNNPEKSGDTKALVQTADTIMQPELHTELYGNYVGYFVDGRTDDEQMKSDVYIDPVKISIQIMRITDKGADGRSVVRGNGRPMTGKLTQAGNNYKFVMDEPGNDKHDGRFNFSIHGDSLIGIWESYDPTVKGPKKKFTLIKIPFQYNANLMLPEEEWEYVDWEKSKHVSELYINEDGTKDTIVNEFYRSASKAVYTINASKQTLTEKQLKNLKKLDLEIIRNTIFARHGYAFKSRGVRQFFDGVEWYIPVSTDVQGELSQTEKDNIALLKRFEKYAQDNYDTFGR